MYGEACYRTDANHLSTYWHPKKSTDADASASASASSTTTTTTTTTSTTPEAPAKIPCKWGKDCYRTSKEHTE